MAVILENQVVFFGPASQPNAVRWWAARGRLHWEDSRNNGYGSLSVRDFLQRLNAVSEMISNGKTKENEQALTRQELLRLTRFIEAGLELVRKAKEQGEPGNVDAIKAAKAARATSVIVPSSLAFL